MEKKQIFIWIGVGVVALAIIIAVYVALLGGSGSMIGDKNGEGTVTQQGTVAAPGSSAINDAGLVVNPNGKAAQNNATPGTPEAPQQSGPISTAQIPSKAIALSVSNKGFSPATFEVKAGSPVILALTSKEDFTHVLAFKDPSLSAIAIGVGPKETRLITFNAPTKPGEYVFYCNVPRHEAIGEIGKMIVK